MKYLILLSGKAQSGKDTFADSLQCLGFHKYSFAKALKDEASRGGWDGAKDERGRILLQQLGTVWRNYEPEHWIRRLQEAIIHHMAVITDCRYRNEISLMEKWGREHGYSVVTVRIERPGHDNGLSPEARSHPSECELEGYECYKTVENDGTLLQFRIGAREWVKCLIESSGS